MMRGEKGFKAFLDTVPPEFGILFSPIFVRGGKLELGGGKFGELENVLL